MKSMKNFSLQKGALLTLFEFVNRRVIPFQSNRSSASGTQQPCLRSSCKYSFWKNPSPCSHLSNRTVTPKNFWLHKQRVHLILIITSLLLTLRFIIRPLHSFCLLSSHPVIVSSTPKSASNLTHCLALSGLDLELFLFGILSLELQTSNTPFKLFTGFLALSFFPVDVIWLIRYSGRQSFLVWALMMINMLLKVSSVFPQNVRGKQPDC